MKGLWRAQALLFCLLPFFLAQPTTFFSDEEGSVGFTLWNMVVLPLQDIRSTLIQILDDINNLDTSKTTLPTHTTTPAPSTIKPRDCAQLYNAGNNESGVYNIYVYNAGQPVPVSVYCDMETEGGGWMVFQRRQDGTVDFFLEWEDYAKGFGNITGEFWLGNDLLHLLTDRKPQKLRIDLGDHEGNFSFAEYNRFSVGSRWSKYQLSISAFTRGSAGDSFFTHHNNHKFSTKDRDNDIAGSNCARSYKGGWWYSNCHDSNLNGLWAETGQHFGTALGQYITWYSWRGNRYSLRFSEMKMRPRSF